LSQAYYIHILFKKQKNPVSQLRSKNGTCNVKELTKVLEQSRSACLMPERTSGYWAW
jgi:hypothetical protein